MCPEYATADGTERLWEFLLSDCERMPGREVLYRKAMDWVERETSQHSRRSGGPLG